MGVPLAVVYTLLLLSTFVLSGIATYMLARALSLSPGASWIAALLFAFCQYRFEHYSHLELQMTQWMPLTLLAALRLLSTGAPRYFVYLALAAAAQWYSSMYYGVFLTYLRRRVRSGPRRGLAAGMGAVDRRFHRSRLRPGPGAAACTHLPSPQKEIAGFAIPTRSRITARSL